MASFGISNESILEDREWYHMKHDVSFSRKGRASHAIQGLGSFWFVGSEFTLIYHEEALASRFVVAQRLGTDYLFDGSALSELIFRRLRNWMLYGLNPLVPATVPRGNLN
jgi:predicted NAD/FAD-binding protein